MHARIHSACTIGIHAHHITIEVDLSLGLLQFFIVGLPDTAIKESRQRISTALKNSGIRLPERKITVNLAPADIKKEGTLFDLPIAIGMLQAAELIYTSLEFLKETLFLGELSLDGSISRIKGATAIAYDAPKLGFKRIVVPESNAQEAALIPNIEVIAANHLIELIAYLRNERTLVPVERLPIEIQKNTQLEDLDFNQIKGQHQAKRALCIAAAGRHNIIFVGPPGSGKTMLAKRLSNIMPPLSFDEMLHISKIYSISGKLTNQYVITERPFRSPHHTISQAGLVGGGSFPQPGEISLAHNGVLFLDELTEFKKTTLEVLRQPLEHKIVRIARAQQSVDFPASFLFVAALNPCPCGFLGDTKKKCFCSKQSILRYLEKLSGPLLDRIDLQIYVPAVEYKTIKESSNAQELSSQSLYELVMQAVSRQRKRFNRDGIYNAQMTSKHIEQYCQLSPEAEDVIKNVFETFSISMRGYHKIIKIARTIADLEDSSAIQAQHIKEAVFYRSLDAMFERLKQ